MFYILYQITNKVNGKIYVGVHKTKDINDGYMGSGKVIRSAIAKHGIENFEKVILETFENAEAMYAREKELVNEDFLSRDDVYNLRRGGTGGFDFINANRLNGFSDTEVARKGRNATDAIMHARYGGRWREKCGSRGGNAAKETRKILMATDPEFRASVKRRAEKASNAALSERARKKRKETLERIGHSKGEKNSQFGTCWIHHELVGSKKCQLDLLPLYIDQGWHKGRK